MLQKDKIMQDRLPDFVLADLYPDSLVLADPLKSAVDAAATPIAEKIVTPAAIIAPPVVKPVEQPVGKTIEKPVENPVEKITKLPKPQKWFLGDNGKKITILVNEPDAVYLNDESLLFLTKILGACKLNLGDVAVVNWLQQPVLFTGIQKDLEPAICLLFDVSTEAVQLPFTVPQYQVQNHGGCMFLLAPALSTYYGESNEARVEKTRLWASLKKMFNI